MESKSKYKSQTLIAIAIGALSKVAGLYFGFNAIEGHEDAIASGIVTVATSSDVIGASISIGTSLVSDIFAAKGRLKANTILK